MATSGREALLEVLVSEGVTHVFGNPGTTELPFMEALADGGDLDYVLALQEATAVGMADGYAQASGRPAFLNLHTSAGLGNAVGNLTNAVANRAPMVVTAGQQDRRHLHHDPLLGGDLVGIARPVAKWAHEATTLAELGTMLRRAFHDAASPPGGPVFVSIPMDLLDEEGEAPVPAPSSADRRSAPQAVEELARRLAAAAPARLAIVAGDEVAAGGAVDALVTVAERLGSRVHGAALHGRAVFPARHPLWAGPLPPAADGIAAALDDVDTVLALGARPFLVYPWTAGPALRSGLELLHVSAEPGEVGRTWPPALGITADVGATLDALVPQLDELADRRAATEALSVARRSRTEADRRFEERARAAYGEAPMPPMAAVHALLEAIPRGTPVVDEAITAGSYVRGYSRAERPPEYLFCRGGGLGWGMPAACGVSLALGGDAVLCVVGDGSALYSPQALWTAANRALPVVFAVVDNRQYRILKDALRRRGGGGARAGRFVGMDLERPAVDFPSLAAGLGVPATSVEKAGDVGEALRAALDAGAPHLLHLPVAAG